MRGKEYLVVKTTTYNVRYPNQSYIQAGLEFGFFWYIYAFILDLFHLLQIDIPWAREPNWDQ